ncbi:MAG: hypothetical protein ABEH77_02275, partial [Halobacteriaceae archaeon]
MTDRDGGRDDGSGDGGPIRFWLPPLRLPPLFPDRFRVALPARPRGRPRVLLAAAVADLADATLLLGGAPVPGYARALGVAVLGWALLGRRGTLALWELGAVALFRPAAAAPTLTLLAGLEFLGLGNPEQVQGDAEREREPPDEREHRSPVERQPPADPQDAEEDQRAHDVD